MTATPRRAEIDPVLAFDLRQDARDARRLSTLQAQGYTHSRCNRCHAVRVLSWEGGDCNEVTGWDDDGAEIICEGIYRPIGGAQ